MDIGLIIVILLQFGLGFAMVTVVRKRRRKNIIDRHPNFWKIAMFITEIWGWLIMVFSTGYLLIYLVSFLRSR